MNKSHIDLPHNLPRDCFNLFRFFFFFLVLILILYLYIYAYTSMSWFVGWENIAFL